MKNDPPDEAARKQALFWGVYMADKGLALRMGRASSIQDWDITIPLPKPERARGPLWHYFTLWVLCARVQGRIYELLYSPESVTQPAHVRQSRVDTLTRELDVVDIRTREANVGSSFPQRLLFPCNCRETSRSELEQYELMTMFH